MGQPLRIAPERARCAAWQEVHGLHVAEGVAWGASEIRQLVHRDVFFLNLHKKCNESWQPAEAFRLSQLLENGAIVLSARSASVDEVEFRGLVDFALFEELPRTASGLWEMSGEDVSRLRQHRALEFSRRFEPAALFRKAGIDRLLMGHGVTHGLWGR